jgi:alkanesulfonate monooxygenase
MLTYTDNTSLDPWAVAQVLIDYAEDLVPLVAVNPVYMHPFAVARMISTFGFVHERQVDLNLVTGGFQRHLGQLGCRLTHDERYDRLAEYGAIIGQLLADSRPVTYRGTYFQVKNLVVTPPLPPSLAPRIFVSGSSAACRRLQKEFTANRLCYPREIDEYQQGVSLRGCGIRLGIIARDTAGQAWQVARRRFPPDPMGEEVHDLAADQVESQWHRTLSRDALRSDDAKGSYWIYPFRSYRTFCPYLVGSYQEVSDLLSRYLLLGVAAIILDDLTEQDDLTHSMIALAHAQAAASALSDGVGRPVTGPG